VYLLSVGLGEARRQLAKFMPDPSVAPIFSASNDDYHKSGWSRGHMAPAGNYKSDQVERTSSTS
jgi:DNA/RNA endonuclease G (NUC1)